MTGATPPTETTPAAAPERSAEDTHLDGLLGYGAPTEAAEPTETPAPAPAAKNGEDKPEAAQAPAAKDKDEPRVPLSALHESRAEVKRLREVTARSEERMAKILERMAPPAAAPAQPQLPNRDEQPIQHFDQRLGTLEERQARFDKWEADQNVANEQAQVRQRIVSEYRAKASEFAAENADFGEAYNFLNQHRIEELKDLGWDQANAEKIVEHDELAIAAKALQDGANPAQRLYAIAKRRGYKAKSPPAAKIETIEKGQKAQGLGGASAAPPANEEVSPSEIANMSDAQFDKWFEKTMTPRQFR